MVKYYHIFHPRGDENNLFIPRRGGGEQKTLQCVERIKNYDQDLCLSNILATFFHRYRRFTNILINKL